MPKNSSKRKVDLHGKPLSLLSRRELLAQGFINWMGYITLPSALHLALNSAYASGETTGCSPSSTNSLCPFVTLNLAGGAALASNFVPHDSGLQPLSSYSKLGLGAAGSFPISLEFKNQAPFAGNNLSQFLVGVRDFATAPTLLKSLFVAVPMRAQDDTSSNKLFLDGMIAKAGRKGSMLPVLGKNRNQSAYVESAPPLEVSSFSSLEGAISVKNSLAQLSKPQQIGLFKLIQNLSEHQRKILEWSSQYQIVVNPVR